MDTKIIAIVVIAVMVFVYMNKDTLMGKKEDEKKEDEKKNEKKEDEKKNEEKKVEPSKVYMKVIPADKGYGDRTKGYYDIQGLGGCYDYCRWVGGPYPGYFSCALANKDNPSEKPSVEYTPKGQYTEDMLKPKKCNEYFYM